MPRKIQGYGCLPDHPDQRDYQFAAPASVLRALPSWVDLRPACPPVYNQGKLGSCTANVIAAALQFDQIKQQAPVFTASRLFIYYNARALDGTVASDNGATIRDTVKSVASVGACPEIMWCYDPAACLLRPPERCYHVAGWHRAFQYERVAQDLRQMKACLAGGFPFAFGFGVYTSFEAPAVAATGLVPLPAAGEDLLGSHAALAVGYDDARHWFIVRNSYGPAWGMRGYFTIPYSYLTSPALTSDLWLIRRIE